MKEFDKELSEALGMDQKSRVKARGVIGMYAIKTTDEMIFIYDGPDLDERETFTLRFKGGTEFNVDYPVIYRQRNGKNFDKLLRMMPQLNQMPQETSEVLYIRCEIEIDLAEHPEREEYIKRTLEAWESTE